MVRKVSLIWVKPRRPGRGLDLSEVGQDPGRQVRGEARPPPRRRVGESEAVRVEELPAQAVLLLSPIGLVSDQRVPDRAEVGADLVGAPGLQLRLEIGG